MADDEQTGLRTTAYALHIHNAFVDVLERNTVETHLDKTTNVNVMYNITFL